jgi:PAS domain S-box-containing protein
MVSRRDALAARVRQAGRHPGVRRVAPTVAAFVAAAAAAAWVTWLRAGPDTAVAVTPAIGVALAVALLLPFRRAVAPLVAVAVAVASVAVVRGTDPAIAVALGVAAVIGAAAAAVLLRVYADGSFRVAGVRDLVALVVAALAGALLAAAVVTAAVALADTGPAWWRTLYRTTTAGAIGMVLVACVCVAVAPPQGRRRGTPLEAILLALACAGAAVAVARWDDPLAFVAVLLLLWAAARFGTRVTALGALVLVGAADWALARGAGPFTPPLVTADGGVLLVQALLGATLLAVLGFATALTERDGAETQRRFAAERSRRTFDHSPVGIAVTNLGGEVLEANRALCLLLGRPESQLLGRTLRSWRVDDTGEHEVVDPAGGLDVGEPRRQRLLRADGETLHVELSEARLRHADGAPDHRILFVQDVSEPTTLRHQLVHAQKMESVGRLAGGIAHDFNNLLAIMRGQVELLQDDLALIERARARIDSVQRATDRAAALTDDLMAFSRRRVDQPETFDLHELLRSLRELLHQLVGPTVSLELEFEADVATILADPNRLEQAVMNLAVNARDAMPSGGRLTFGTSNVSVADGPSYVVLAVRDTGIGMDESTRARVFEPFFTTKPPGMGTGLGMSTTADIVRAAGGTIEVRSALGRGSTFLLGYPTVEPAAADLGVRGPGSEARPASGTVLVVDDEPDVRTLVSDILRDAGYFVLVAPDGKAALALLDRSPHVDLLVTDVVMPVMSGTDLAARVEERAPGTPVLFVSGFVPAGAAALRGAPLLTKPLRRADLLDAVRALVPGGQDTPGGASAPGAPDAQGSKR